MKVVMFSRFPRDVEKPRGGVESATLGLLRGLAKLEGIELHLVTLEKGLSGDTIEKLGWITVHRLPRSNWPMFIDTLIGPGRRKVDSYIRSLSPDVVHFQETYGIGAKDVGAPSVFTVHGFDSLNLPAAKQSLWKLRSLIWQYVETKGLRDKKYVVSITPYVRDEIGVRTKAKIFDIDNAISEKYFSLERKEVHGRIFFAGWLNPRKNAVALVRAFSLLRKKGVLAELIIAGEASDEGYFSKIKEAINEGEVADSVSLLGRIDQGDIQKELQQASIFVLPSYQENAPMAIAEAMAVGVPVISSNVCGMPYMIDEGRTGYLVGPDDVTALADRMAAVLQDSELSARMGQDCKEEAKKRYHPSAVAQKTLALYREIIASGSS